MSCAPSTARAISTFSRIGSPLTALSYRFEHDPVDTDGDSQAFHELVIFDRQEAAFATAGNPVVRFHGLRAAEDDGATVQFGV